MTVLVNNAEYGHLFSQQGIDTDKLCAVFCMLRFAKGGERRIIPQGRLGHYGLIQKATGLKRHATEKYVKKLAELGFVTLNKDRGISIIGRNRSFKLFKDSLRKNKHFPITIGRTLQETALFVGAVRVRSNVRQQEKQIERKDRQRKLLNTHRKQLKDMSRTILSIKRWKEAEELLKQYGSIETFTNKICKETILSIYGFDRLSKGQGKYFRNRLKKAGIIRSEIRTETLHEEFIPMEVYIQNRGALREQFGMGVFRETYSGQIKRFLANRIEVLSNGQKTAS